MSQSMEQSERWERRDWTAAAGLFLATAAVVLGQNAHLVVLWDLSYVLDSAARMALGQMPYRDIPFAHAPLTFLIQAAIIRLTGRVFFHHVVYCAVVGGLGTVAAWRIVLGRLRGRMGAAWAVSVALAAPLCVLGLYCILPLPSYDCDCIFAVLVAVGLLQRVARSSGAAEESLRFAGIGEGHPPGAKAPALIQRLSARLKSCPFAPMPWLMARVKSWADTSCSSGCISPQDAKSWPDTRTSSSAAFSDRGLLCAFAAGTAAVVPLFFKQNIGLVFLAAVVGAVLLLLGARLLGRGQGDVETEALLAVLAGAAAALFAALVVIHFSFGLGNYVHWTIGFAAQRRMPGLAAMAGVYREPLLLWMLPCVVVGAGLARSSRAKAWWARGLALALLAAPFVWTLVSFWIADDADDRADSLLALWPLLLIVAAGLVLLELRRGLSLRALLPAIVLATINGTLLSQQLWGSTYAIWPLLVVLLADFVLVMEAGLARVALAAVVAGTLLVCGGMYTASEERLSYADFPEGPVMHASAPALAGMATPGPYLPDFEELLRYAAKEIPAGDGVILLPGEDPFYFATGRVPRFPVLLFDPATDPYSPEEVAAEARGRGIGWVVVKRELQIKADPTPEREAVLAALLRDFKLSARLGGYDIYRRP